MTTLPTNGIETLLSNNNSYIVTYAIKGEVVFVKNTEKGWVPKEGSASELRRVWDADPGFGLEEVQDASWSVLGVYVQ